MQMRQFGVVPLKLTRANYEVPFTIAGYQDEPAPRHAKNLFVRALPALPSDDELRAALTNRPPIDALARTYPAERRLLELATVDQVLIALDRHVDFLRAVMLNKIQGYEPRGPNTPEDIAHLRELYAQAGIPNLFSDADLVDPTTELSFGLLGASGSGKSFTMKSIVKLFPRAIYHKDINRWQIPFLRIEMVFDGKSPHTLASELFEAMDYAIPGAKHFETYVIKCRLNSETRLAIALRLARQYGVGCIIVDESQRRPGTTADDAVDRKAREARSRAEPHKQKPLLSLLVTASNKGSIPLCISGTLEGIDLLSGGYSKTRRVMGHGSNIWGPLNPTFNLDEKRKMGEFEHYMAGLFEYQWVKTPLQLDKGVLVHFWNLTQGIPDNITKLFHAAQKLAIVSGGTEELTHQLIEDAHRAEMIAGVLHMQALEDGTERYAELARDLCHPLVTPLHRVRVARAMKAAGIDSKTMKSLPAPYADIAQAAADAAASPGMYGGQSTTGAQAKASLMSGLNPGGARKRS